MNCPVSPKRKLNSCIELNRHMFKLLLFEEPVNEYLSGKDSALSPLKEIDEDELSIEPEEYNENVLIFSNRTEKSIYDSSLNQILKSPNKLF